MESQHRGKITSWKEEKGFGFITPEAGGGDVFVHASSLPAGVKRPPKNAAVSYVLGKDERGRPRAVSLRFDRDPATMPLLPALAAGLFFTALAATTWGAPLIFIVYAVMSALTFWAYGVDKAAAVRNEGLPPGARRGRRTPELRLHMLELLGGWPGALVAQWYYRHKNRKPSYQVRYWLIVLVHILLLSYSIAVSYTAIV